MLRKDLHHESIVVVQTNSSSWLFSSKFVSSEQAIPIFLFSLLCPKLLKCINILRRLVTFPISQRIVQMVLPALIVHSELIVATEVIDVDLGDMMSSIFRG